MSHMPKGSIHRTGQVGVRGEEACIRQPTFGFWQRNQGLSAAASPLQARLGAGGPRWFGSRQARKSRMRCKEPLQPKAMTSSALPGVAIRRDCNSRLSFHRSFEAERV